MEKQSEENFINSVVQLQGDKYDYKKTIYINQRTAVIVTCKKHLFDFSVMPSVLLGDKKKGNEKRSFNVGSCPKCQEEYFLKIKLEYFERLKEKHNYKYEYDINNYVNEKIPFNGICKIHENFLIIGKNHIRGHNKCPLCELVKQTIKTINNIRYYNCSIHGNIPIGKNRSKGDGCPKCNIEKQKILNKDKLLNRLIGVYGEKYDIIVGDVNIIFTCKKHGTPNIISRKEMQNCDKKVYFCDTCRLEKNIRTSDEAKIFMKTKAREIINNEYKNIYEYLEFIDCGNTEKCKVKLYNVLSEKERIVNAKTILDGELSKKDNDVLRNTVDYDEAKRRVNELDIKSFREYKKWHVRTKQTEMPSNPHRVYVDRWISHFEFFNTDKMDYMSVGERRIYNYLERKNIEFVWQKKFKDCKDKRQLPFDFYLLKYNLIVEFDGIQHYEITSRFGEESLEKTQKHDRIKNKYCADNKINIFRLSYEDLSNNMIEWMLDDELSKIAAEMAIQ
jgi:very-short-patch-repair endonuclease